MRSLALIAAFTFSIAPDGDRTSPLDPCDLNRYVERRFKELRYTDGEAKPVRLALEEAKKKGGIMSEAQKAEMPECPSCKGAASGFLLR